MSKSMSEIIENFKPEDLDAATKSKGFRQATTMLLAGRLTVPEWRWFVVEAVNDAVDIPVLTESQERPIFRAAFTAVGQVLEGLLLSAPVDGEFRDKTIALLQGKATVDEWLDVAGEVIDAAVDIPYVPSVGEEMIFDRALDLIAKALHGAFAEGSSEEG